MAVKRNKLPAQEDLRELFDYHQDGGLIRKLKNTPEGKRVGKRTTTGYLQVMINGKQFMLHRLIWVYHFGDIPEVCDIDHIDHDIANNRIENLRMLVRDKNQHNKSVSRNSKSGITGVYQEKRYGRWCANIGVNNKQIRLGNFLTKEEAATARKEAEHKYGYLKNHGQVPKAKRLPSLAYRCGKETFKRLTNTTH